MALFALVIMMLPIWALVTTYDQTASDIETKHVRYMLFRTDRDSLYLGKSLGALVLVAGSMALALGVLGTFLGLYSSALEGVEGIFYLIRIWATAVLYTLPFIALFGLMGAFCLALVMTPERVCFSSPTATFRQLPRCLLGATQNWQQKP